MQQGDRRAAQAVRGHLAGAEGGPAGGRGGQVPPRLGLPGARQDRGGAGEHSVGGGLGSRVNEGEMELSVSLFVCVWQHAVRQPEAGEGPSRQ